MFDSIFLEFFSFGPPFLLKLLLLPEVFLELLLQLQLFSLVLGFDLLLLELEVLGLRLGDPRNVRLILSLCDLLEKLI